MTVSSTTSYSEDILFELSDGNETKTVYGWFMDVAGNISAWTDDSIVLDVDVNPPASPSIIVNNGDATTDNRTVALSLSASDDVGIVAYYLSESSARPNLNDSRWDAIDTSADYSAYIPYTLSTGEEIKTVYAWFKDAVSFRWWFHQ